ncbi:ABC transporter substrate-binding protein [Parvibaculum sp.]|uniref:MlaC/ttg2D family ABC transporter substrate-binding protein n=1 Tax=Parvibaculum sp. TaxID=2024848 RepID=UPI0032102A86
MSPLNFVRSAVAPVAFCVALLTSIVGSLPAQAANTDPAAEAWVSEVSQQAIKIISDKSLDRAGREAQFAALLDTNADMQRIAAFCLGQFLRTPTPDQKSEYIKLFNNFVVKVYVTRLSDYHDEKLVITGSQLKGDTQALVQSQINFTNGREPVKVTWWLLKKDGGYKLFDVNVVGVWLAQEQRSAFTSVINNHNGDFAALLDHLKQQIADAENGKLPTTAATTAQ